MTAAICFSSALTTPSPRSRYPTWKATAKPRTGSTASGGPAHLTTRSAWPSPLRQLPRSSSPAAKLRHSFWNRSARPASFLPVKLPLVFHGGLCRAELPTAASWLPSLAASVPAMLSSMHSISVDSSTIGGPVRLPRIAVTIGDPAGVGAEINSSQSSRRARVALARRLIVIGDHVASLEATRARLIAISSACASAFIRPASSPPSSPFGSAPSPRPMASPRFTMFA